VPCPVYQQSSLIPSFNDLFIVAQRDGLLSIEKHIESTEQSEILSKNPKFIKNTFLKDFFCDTLKVMLSGGVPPHELEGLMDVEIETFEIESKPVAATVARVGDSLPGLGIVAAVLGIIITMSSIDQGAQVVQVGHERGARGAGRALALGGDAEGIGGDGRKGGAVAAVGAGGAEQRQQVGGLHARGPERGEGRDVHSFLLGWWSTVLRASRKPPAKLFGPARAGREAARPNGGKARANVAPEGANAAACAGGRPRLALSSILFCLIATIAIEWAISAGPMRPGFRGPGRPGNLPGRRSPPARRRSAPNFGHSAPGPGDPSGGLFS